MRPAILALVLAIAQPLFIGAAGAVPTTAVNETRVTIPFAPPLGKTLHYRLSRSRSDSKDGPPTPIDLYVRFDRAGELGYRMHTRMAAAGLAEAVRRAPAMRLLEVPVIFRVDQEGTITAVEGEPDYWRNVETIYDTVAEWGPAKTGDERKMMAGLYDQMRRLPDDQRLALISKNVRPIVEMTGGEFELGETIELDDEAALPFVPLADSKLPRRLLLTAARSGPDAVTVAVEVETDPAALKAAIGQLMAMGPKGKEAKIPEKVKLSQKVSYLVSTRTGLTSRYSETIEASGGPEQAKRVTTLVLLNP